MKQGSKETLKEEDKTALLSKLLSVEEKKEDAKIQEINAKKEINNSNNLLSQKAIELNAEYSNKQDTKKTIIYLLTTLMFFIFLCLSLYIDSNFFFEKMIPTLEKIAIAFIAYLAGKKNGQKDSFNKHKDI